MSKPSQESLDEAVRMLNEAEQARYPGDPYRHREDAIEAQVLATVLDEHDYVQAFARHREQTVADVVAWLRSINSMPSAIYADALESGEWSAS